MGEVVAAKPHHRSQAVAVPALATASALADMSVPSTETGAGSGAKASEASSASVYASSPCAHPELHTRTRPDVEVPAARPAARRPR